MTAALLPDPWAINVEPVELEEVQRQRRAIHLELSDGPIHGAPSSLPFAVPDVTKVPAIFDRRGVLELGGPQFLLDVPVRMTVRRGIKKGTLQRCHGPIDGTLAPARHACEGILGGRAKSGAIRR